MANYTITAANVVPSAAAIKSLGTAGETITPGMPVYLKSSDGRLWKADADASLETATVAGIALNVASAGQPLWICTQDPEFAHGTSATSGALWLSATAGALCPEADVYAVGLYPQCIAALYADTVTLAALNCSALYTPEVGA